MKFFLLGLNLLIASSLAFAADNHYSIIVDAGSSGSRLHILQYEKNKKIPEIKDIFSEKVTPGISSFADAPEKVGAYIQKVFDHAKEKLIELGIDPKKVTASVLATAGMRLVPEEKQAKIYANLNQFLKTNYPFRIKKVETIPGKMEGLYGWLDVNYLAKTFQKHSKTIGSLDMGGASTQIVFETNNASRPDDIMRLTLDGQQYKVFSKSFLNLGLNEARQRMNEGLNANKCYTNDFPLKSAKGEFDLKVCQTVFEKIIEEKHVKDQLIPFDPSQQFVAYSGAFSNYNFFDLLQTLDQSSVEKRVHEYCGEKHWNWWKQTFPKESLDLLPNYCANLVYLEDLFYSTYGIKGSNLTVTDKIDQQVIDWTLGALLYQIIGGL